jgi:hypothetical protein
MMRNLFAAILLSVLRSQEAGDLLVRVFLLGVHRLKQVWKR